MSGVPEDEAGDLGSSSLQWSNAYIKDRLIIEGDVVTGASNVTTITALGTSQVVLPSDVYKCQVQIFGAGGGGGAGSNAAGGGGGAYINLELDILTTAGRTLDLFVGTGGAGRGTSGVGNVGGDSYVTINGTEIARSNGGNGGSSPSAGGSIAKVLPVVTPTDYRILSMVTSNGGPSGGLPTVLAGYTSIGGGSFPTYGGGASISGNGGDANNVGFGGGGGGYTDGANDSASLTGAGGNGAIIVTYFKGTR